MSKIPLYNALVEAVGNDMVTPDAPLSELTRWRVGGRAAAHLSLRSSQDLLALVTLMRGREEPLLIFGQAANLLFDSAPFRGVVAQLSGAEFTKISVEGTTIRAGAGCRVRDLVEVAAGAGLAGIEHAVGVPGTLGGLTVMNGGTNRRGIGENVSHIEVLDSNLSWKVMDQHDAQFEYRKSVFQHDSSIILNVTLDLEPERPEVIRARITQNLRERSLKFPETEANGGSTFLSNPLFYHSYGPPGRMIEDAGLKGLTIGGAQVSHMHANFINNIGHASSDDILRLIWEVRQRVFAKTGHYLECEVRYVTHAGVTVPAHQEAERRWRRLTPTCFPLN